MKIMTIPSPFALAKYQYQLILADTGIQLMRFTYVSAQCLLVVPVFHWFNVKKENKLGNNKNKKQKRAKRK